jgi:hypothetical protein
LEAAAHARGSAHEAKEELSPAIYVPSPLGVLVDLLTVPSRPESAAYGFALARSILFSEFKTHPPMTTLPSGWSELSISEIQASIEGFRLYAKHRDNIPYPRRSAARALVAHFLAMSGNLVLRFGTAGKKALEVEKAQRGCMAFLQSKRLVGKEPVDPPEYEFRLAQGLMDLPDTQELLNSFMGVPLPLAGAATVFFGGLQRSHDNSLVISVSGCAGTGKTSFALALAGMLAPFGTQCVYCTFEEDAETLKRRAGGLVPQYFRRTTLMNSGVGGWLHPICLDPTLVRGIRGFASEYLPILKEQLASVLEGSEATPTSVPGIAPVLVVLDSLTTIMGGEMGKSIDEFCAFVRHLKDLHCIVLLLSAEGVPQGSRLEYLVDTVVSLRHEDIHTVEKKPFRLFQLVKTRLQMSRPGSHVLYLSGELGLRLSPQLPSQLDSDKTHKTSLPEYSTVIDTFKPDERERDARQIPLLDVDVPGRLVNIYPRSKVLIHGHGSSSKAALALRMLMSPLVNAKSGRPVRIPAYRRLRILAISFLYPEEFYSACFRQLSYPYAMTPEVLPKLRVLALSPGFIGPRDFVDQVLREIEQGYLEGWPYSGVLLDGLHNTFLQFPSLQASPMVWPALYSLLSRHELTIITTFTTFSTNKAGHASHRPEDEDIILQGQLPFIQMLTQGTDFYLRVEPQESNRQDRMAYITVESAVGQRLPTFALEWHGDTFAFGELVSLLGVPRDPQLALPLK